MKTVIRMIMDSDSTLLISRELLYEIWADEEFCNKKILYSI